MAVTLDRGARLNGRNWADTKEVVRRWSVVVAGERFPYKRDLRSFPFLREPITVRWYMGRSSSASVVYCSVWVRGVDHEWSGHGKAGGFGYDKYSASFEDALSGAGIKLSSSIHGAGDMAVRGVLKDVIQAIGYSGCPMLIVE